jgi:hypothetical protein
MIRISDIVETGFGITWTLLLICFESCGLLRNCSSELRFISSEEVIGFAINSLDNTSNPDIVGLAVLKSNEIDNILDFLRKLSCSEDCDYKVEFRKFRVLYLLKNMPNTSIEFVHGMLRISELWDQFGFPEDSPNIWFRFEDFSPENYQRLLGVNIAWLANEIKLLRAVCRG